MIQSNSFELPDGTYDLNIGKSFSKSSKNRQEFHTLRYDFKPKSVSNEQEAYIALGSNDDVHIAFANDTADNLTVYKGSNKPIKDGKECLLIFDEDRQEMRLEKVVSNLNVKQARGVDEEVEQAIRTQIDKSRKNRKLTKRKNSSPSSVHKMEVKPAADLQKINPIPDNVPSNEKPLQITKKSHSTEQIFAEMSSSDESSSSEEDEEEGEIVDNSEKKEVALTDSPKSDTDGKPRRFSFELKESESDGESSSSSCDGFAAALERQLKTPVSPVNEDDDDMPDLSAPTTKTITTPPVNVVEKPSSNSSSHDRHQFTLSNIQNNLANDLDLSESDEDSD